MHGARGSMRPATMRRMHTSTAAMFGRRAAASEGSSIRDDDKDRRRNLVRERMEPIRMAYRRMKPRQRAQLLADILQYMEVGTTDEKSTRW